MLYRQVHVADLNTLVFIAFRVSHRQRAMYIGHARLCVSVFVSVCLSVPHHIPALLHGPGCNLGEL